MGHKRCAAGVSEWVSERWIGGCEYNLCEVIFTMVMDWCGFIYGVDEIIVRIAFRFLFNSIGNEWTNV